MYRKYSVALACSEDNSGHALPENFESNLVEFLEYYIIA